MPFIHITYQSSRWCEEGIFLLAGQPVDRCQSQEGAEAALRELECYLETAPQHALGEPAVVCAQYEAVVTGQLRVSQSGLWACSSS